MAGVRLRMPGGDAWQFLGEALGANPTPMAYAEVYTGLQTGAIDGQDNPLPNVENMKFYEVMSQIVMTSHLVGYDLLTVASRNGRENQRPLELVSDRRPARAGGHQSATCDRGKGSRCWNGCVPWLGGSIGEAKISSSS
jgi:hypothetical protein